MKLWILEGRCGDYYCGCSGPVNRLGSHLIGVYTSPEAAERAREIATGATHSYASHGEDGKRFSTWDTTDGPAIEEIETDQMPNEYEVH